jgi:glycosyltransferase involved in cell wall biosynthesis
MNNEGKRIGIITRTLPPYACGIGDYTMVLADSVRSLGYHVELFAGKGQRGKYIHLVDDEWNYQSLSMLFIQLEKTCLNRLVLQYIPGMYSNARGEYNYNIADFWHSCSQRWKTVLILHETYFRVWWYPPSWWRGTKHKRLLRSLANSSHLVLSPSGLLIEEIKAWNQRLRAYLLPNGSHFPVVPSDREKWRHERKIDPNDIVLILFGGGNSLKWLRGHVNAVDALLSDNGIRARWLLLGGVPREWFKLNSPVISPGRLPEAAISSWLQASDIFLMPHFAGLCARRTTLMAAMQHALPVVGTRGMMTEAFWSEVQGVGLVPVMASRRFSRLVLTLASDRKLREIYGHCNRDYYRANFSWDHISRKFLELVQ